MSGAVTAAVVGGTIAAGAGIAGSAIQAGAAGKAADKQAQTAQQAAEYQKQATQQALQYQQQQNQQTQQNLAPWQQTGQQANSALSRLLGIGGPNAGQTPYSPNGQPQGITPQPQLTATTGNTSTLAQPQTSFTNPTGAPTINATSGAQQMQPGVSGYNPQGIDAPVGAGGNAMQVSSGQLPMAQGTADPNAAPGTTAASGVGGYGSLLTPYQDFTAPTGLTMQNDPGYQARLQLGTDAIQRSAAARGNVLTGGTAKALETYGQDYGSNEYGNVYNRALNSYQTNQGNYYTGQNNAYSRLMGVSGAGENAATTASSLGQSGANSIASTIMGGAQAANNQANNAAQATASGYLNQGNIIGSGIVGAGNNFSNLYQLQNQGDPYKTLYNAQNPASRSNVSTQSAYTPYIS